MFNRTVSLEVAFIAADSAGAIETKSTDSPNTDHLKGLRALREEPQAPRCMLVCRVPRPRRTDDGIEILPWRDFLRRLWAGEIVA
jgi:hypothetical protein